MSHLFTTVKNVKLSDHQSDLYLCASCMTFVCTCWKLKLLSNPRIRQMVGGRHVQLDGLSVGQS